MATPSGPSHTNNLHLPISVKPYNLKKPHEIKKKDMREDTRGDMRRGTNEAQDVKEEDKPGKSDSVQLLQPICKDYLNGRCSRIKCKYQHVVTVYNPLYEPRQIISKLFLSGKGNVFINLNNFARQQYHNGLFLCNLGDIISSDFMSKLITLSMTSRYVDKIDPSVNQNIRALVSAEMAVNNWSQQIQQIINWTTSETTFNKTNYSTIFIYDICDLIRVWISKINIVKYNNTCLIKNLQNCLNMMFTCIFDSLPSHVLDSMNLYVSYLKDELSLGNRGSIEYIYSLISARSDKYVGNHFKSNVYYIGYIPNFDYAIDNQNNLGFRYCCINGLKYLNLSNVLNNVNSDIIELNNTYSDKYMTNYVSELSKHNTLIYQNIFGKNAQLKTALMSSISLDNIRPNTLMIIGCNLDAEFDNKILAGLKDTIGGIDFIKYKEASKSNITNAATVKKPNPLSESDDCCNEEPQHPSTTTTTTTTTISIIIPDCDNSTSKTTTSVGDPNQQSTQLNDLMRDLLGGIFEGKSIKPNTPSKLIQHRVCTIGINIIKSINGAISLGQPFDTVVGIEKIKEYGLEPNNKIIILCSPRMTHDFFSDFIKQITQTPGYPTKISANFVEFNINPSLRKCLAYHNYRAMYKQHINLVLPDIPIIQMSKLSVKFANYLDCVSKYADNSKNMSVVKINDTINTNNLDKTSANIQDTQNAQNTQCCKCCSCLSNNGIGYSKFGHFPYIPLEQLKLIDDDSWFPRH